MKTASHRNIGIIIILCTILSGCSLLLQRPIDVLRDSCKAVEQPKPGVTFKLGGLEIPFKPEQPIKIGTINFTAEDARRISDEIYAMAETRRSQCSIIAASLLGVPPPTGAQILAMQDGINNVKKKSDDLVRILTTSGATSEEALRKAEEAKAAADNEAAKAKVLVVTDSKVGINDLSDELREDVENFRKLVTIKERVDKMQKDISEIRNSKNFIQISVTGFDADGIALTAPMKNELANQIESILSVAGSSSVPRIAIVGYADETGTYLRNLDIGLQRATSVALYLKRAFPQRAEITTISSGGVRSHDANARRVDVLIS